MPRKHTSEFPVRFYECDAYSHLNNSNYVRYMQEAAFAASADAGYNDDRYSEMGVIWLIRDTEVEYLKPLRYGDTAAVTTWVGDFRRVRSRRIYQIQNQEANGVLARGSTDWVLLDRETFRPVTIPEEMKIAFFPEGAPPQAMPRDPFPKAPQAPVGAVTIRRQVAWEDVDPAGHVNNAKYFSYIEEAGIQAAAQYGVRMSDFLERGYGSVARKSRIEYKEQVRLGEQLEINTYLSDVRATSATRHFILRRAEDQALVAQAYVLWVYIDINTGRPARFPQEARDRLVEHIAEGA
ncbi:MAG: thioesterase family protein [Chloroflexota bacterium]